MEPRADRIRGLAVMLLKVCAVLVVLAGLFVGVPVWFFSRHTEAKPACAPSLKNLLVSFIIYASDYDDRLPLGNWIDSTMPYTKNETTYKCVGVAAGSRYGYALHKDMVRARLADFSTESQQPLLFDALPLKRNLVADLTALPRPGRHEGANNVCSVDGHVRVRRPWSGGAHLERVARLRIRAATVDRIPP